MATYNVSFQYDRHGNRRRENVTIPDCVPHMARNRAIKYTLMTMGWLEACDVIIAEKAVTISAVEAGIPNTDEYSSIDILGAGF